jgi:DNA mismatch endonuclease (patch repair protein)
LHEIRHSVPIVIKPGDNPERKSYRFTVPDVFTKKQRSQVMAAVRSRGNRETEQKLVGMLRRAGITGWRRHQTLPGRPDFVFRRQRLAIFVDGCFWHGCRWHCRMPQDNREYWQRKISRNATRDRSTTRLLRRSGWRVLRIWAHSLRSPEIVLRRITSELSGNPKGCNNGVTQR